MIFSEIKNNLIGLTLKEARIWTNENGFYIRVMSKQRISCSDLQPKRINVIVNDNKIVKILTIG